MNFQSNKSNNFSKYASLKNPFTSIFYKFNKKNVFYFIHLFLTVLKSVPNNKGIIKIIYLFIISLTLKETSPYS